MAAPKGYMYLSEVDAMVEPMESYGWKKANASFSIHAFEKDGIRLEFRYGYNRFGGAFYERDKPRTEIMRKVTQVRMYFRDRSYHDVAKWTSYPKFSKEWLDKTFETLKAEKDLDKVYQKQSEDRSDFLRSVRERADAMNKAHGFTYGPIEGYEHSPNGTPQFKINLTGLSEEQVLEVIELYKKYKNISQKLDEQTQS